MKHPFHHLAESRLYHGRRTYYSMRNQSVTDIERRLFRGIVPQPKLLQDEVFDPFRLGQVEPYGPVLPVPTDLEPEERTALPFQLDPCDHLSGANLCVSGDPGIKRPMRAQALNDAAHHGDIILAAGNQSKGLRNFLADKCCAPRCKRVSYPRSSATSAFSSFSSLTLASIFWRLNSFDKTF